MDLNLTEAIEEVKISLIEGIINRQGTYDKGTFDPLFDFHVSVVKMFTKREESLKEEIKRLTGEH